MMVGSIGVAMPSVGGAWVGSGGGVWSVGVAPTQLDNQLATRTMNTVLTCTCIRLISKRLARNE